MLPPNSLIVRPIGGAAQIGSNITEVLTDNVRIYIDCGILFPSDDCFDINYLIADLKQAILSNEIDALIITHGHEDHIGAVAHFVLQFPNVPIFAPKFAEILIKEKLTALNLNKKIHIYNGLQNITLKDVQIRPIQVNHSIPDTFGLVIEHKTTDTALFFCSDFKVNNKDTYEPAFNLSQLQEILAPFKKRVCLTDSTNIMSSQRKTLDEFDIINNLENIISSAPSRVFVTSFASNIHRLQSIFNIAKDLKKRVVLYGGSIKKYALLAKDNDYLETHGLDRDPEEVELHSSDLIIISSGCQGDFKSATRRIAMREDKFFKLTAEDFFIFSSKTIPGNEKKISALLNKISEQGAHIFTDHHDTIHASGHAGATDLELLYEKTSPTHVFPIHGESLFLSEHCKFVRKNFPQIETDIIYNYDTLIMTPDNIKIDKACNQFDPIIIQGNLVEIPRECISQRRKIAQSGIITICLHRSKRKLTFSYDAIGLPLDLLPDQAKVDALIKSCQSHPNANEEIRIRLRRLVAQNIGIKPIVKVYELT